MPTRIPMVENDFSGLQRGVEQGTSAFHNLLGQGIQRAQLQQQWQEHLRNAAIREQQEERLRQEFELNKQYHPYKILELQNQANNAPLEYEHLKAKIDALKASAEKSRKPENADKAARAAQLKTPWSNMTTTQRENLAALANRLKIRPDVFVEGMTSGKTFEKIAQEHGYNPEEVANAIPKYLATSGNVKLENERQKNLSELNVIEEYVTDAMAPYISTFAGYSPKQIIDSFKGQNQDQLAKYLAARALAPEISSLRIKTMGGTVGQGAIEEITHAALGSSRILQGQVTPEVYKKMNYYIKQWLKEGSQAATESIYGAGNKENEKTSEKTESRQRYNPVTDTFE